MKIAAGSIDRIATIRNKTVANDTAGQPIETWTNGLSIWVGRSDIRGAEVFAANERAAEIEVVFTCRWTTLLTVQNRLACEGREYEIVSIFEINRREGMLLGAKARAE